MSFNLNNSDLSGEKINSLEPGQFRFFKVVQIMFSVFVNLF